MSTTQGPANNSENLEDSHLVKLLSEKVVGQPGALKYIVPYIHMFQAGFAPPNRPAGVFMLLGPTGTGKTKTVEAVAEILHGSEKNLVRVDCGEYQMEHEVAKLIGAPPGYLGHKETVPVLTQKKLAEVTSPGCDLSIILFDEIEKAAPTVGRLLLGILDKAILRLGDSTSVNFEKSFVFLTSNLGAKEIMKELNPNFGFQAGTTPSPEMAGDIGRKIESVALAAVRRRFSPEFVNRIDAVITYQPLDEQALLAILDREIAELQRHVDTRLGDKCFSIDVSPESREFLLRKGTSTQYGARELKRTIHRNLTQPLATMVASGQIAPAAGVRIDVAEDGESLRITPRAVKRVAPERTEVLLVDDNRDLLKLFELQLARTNWKVLTAETGVQCEQMLREHSPSVIVLDYLLPDANGVELAMHIRALRPDIPLIIATGAELAGDDLTQCESASVPILRKPFLLEELTNQIRTSLNRAKPQRAASSRGGAKGSGAGQR